MLDAGRCTVVEQASYNWMRDNDLYDASREFSKLVGTGILSSEGLETPWFEPVITKLLILIADLLKAADKIGKRYTALNDIAVIDDHVASKIRDVTDLIIWCRSAACHISSGNHLFETNKFQFNVCVGKVPSMITVDNKRLGSDYEDEIAIIWGPTRLYLRRHLMAAYEYLMPLFPDPFEKRRAERTARTGTNCPAAPGSPRDGAER